MAQKKPEAKACNLLGINSSNVKAIATKSELGRKKTLDIQKLYFKMTDYN